jgi:5-methylthioadenosine/S-adenosylhomocysteine deaminase
MKNPRLHPAVARRVVFLLSASLVLLATAWAGQTSRQKADLIVTGGTVITMDPSHRILRDGAVAISGERIAAVGPSAEIAARYQAAQVIPAAGSLIMPGLINGHNHVPMVLFRGIADDMNLSDWLEKFIFPAEAKNVTNDFVAAGTALGCLEMIRSGTTTFADMYYFEDRVAEVTARAGMRGILGETILQFPAPDNKTPEAAFAYTEKFIARWKGNTLITPVPAPHAPYTNTADMLRTAKALADKNGVPMLIHVSETQDEMREISQKYGTTPTQWLESLGVLGPNVFFAHGVWLTEEDLAIVKRRGVTVAHNPDSNMKLASGTAPVTRMLELGIPVGLGTDGAASNNDLDMFEVMDLAAKLQKLARMNPTVLPAEQVVAMATIGGARALGMEKEIGSLESGKRADLILVNTGGAHATPMYNPYSHLVYALKAADVQTSIINGKVVMRDRRVLTLDEAAVESRAREFQARIVQSLK